MRYRFAEKLFFLSAVFRWLVGSKLLGGYVHYPQLKLTGQFFARSGFCMGSGVSLTFKAKEHYGIRFSSIIIYFRRIAVAVPNG